MELIKAKNQQQLPVWAANLPQAEFLQTALWPQVIKAEAVDLLVKDGAKIVAVGRVLKRSAWGLNFAASPRAPLFAPECNVAAQSAILNFMAKNLPKHLSWQPIFWRVEPVSATTSEQLAGNLQWAKSVNLQPAQTLLLDLQLSEDQLLAAMHQKTRYNIRLAQKKNLSWRWGTVEDVKVFAGLMAETTERDSFRGHSLEHYSAMLELGSDIFKLLLVEYQGRVLAAGIFAIFGDTFTYVHGASSNADRALMAPYLLQWQAIGYAREQGCRYYDFFGIDEQKWPGVTRFKLGFGGFVKTYPGTFDIIFNSGYYSLYLILRRLRRWLPF
jgi:hypothetical protein